MSGYIALRNIIIVIIIIDNDITNKIFYMYMPPPAETGINCYHSPN